jgi:hypothetical protein
MILQSPKRGGLGVALALVGFFALFVTALQFIARPRDQPTDRLPIEELQSANGAVIPNNGELNSATKRPAPLQIAPQVHQSIAGKESSLDKAIRDALAANTAAAAIASLATVAGDANVSQHLSLIGATCRGSIRLTTNAKGIDRESVEGGARAKLSDFSKTYCGDVPTLLNQIATVRSKYSATQISEREKFVEALFAAKRTESTANAIINEILASPDLRQSVYAAEGLSALSSEDEPLSNWRRYLPRLATQEDRRIAFTIAGELLNCPRLGGCGTNQFYLAYQCVRVMNCAPGEDLLSYRRRTTSPMLYQAAEQIAAAMQARRYR